MCLAIPLKVSRIKGNLAEVDTAGVKRQVDIRLLKNVKVGDYILVHAGFGIEKIDEEKARETLQLFKDINCER
jgi:hydrogenase expression/formation protein HypC